MNNLAPPLVTHAERWIVKNPVIAVRVELRQTGVDTSATYLHLTAMNGKTVCWEESTFRKVARLEIGVYTVVSPNWGLKEKVEARDKWIKENAAELAEFMRLKAKFEGAAEKEETPNE